jgi:hypothetical protein
MRIVKLPVLKGGACGGRAGHVLQGQSFRIFQLSALHHSDIKEPKLSTTVAPHPIPLPQGERDGRGGYKLGE